MEAGPGDELLRAIDSADDLIHNSPSVPWIAQVRLRRAELDQAISRIERAAVFERIEPGTAFAETLNRVKQIANEARPIPLTRDVRCGRATLAAAVDELRAAVPEPLKEAAAGWRQTEGADPPETLG
jgi:hypothetical protein